MKSRMNLMVVCLLTMMLTGCGACRSYERDQSYQDAQNDGKSELIKAESSKKILVETAKANLEAARLNAQADQVRAEGIAASNKIIGQSLQNNKAYLEWLWIDNIEKNPNAVFYIPTENKVPIFMNNVKQPVIPEEKKKE